ncbi:MAG: hypothetical protein LBK61_00920, partial [Spirochaetaceae bacterium]|nr:hypothetical protein [Spirochaetaceae bacterium]
MKKLLYLFVLYKTAKGEVATTVGFPLLATPGYLATASTVFLTFTADLRFQKYTKDDAIKIVE